MKIYTQSWYPSWLHTANYHFEQLFDKQKSFEEKFGAVFNLSTMFRFPLILFKFH